MKPLQALGPDGVRQRIEDIRGRIARFSPQTSGFGEALTDAQPTSLQGSIGGGAIPFNPFGGGASVSPNKAELQPLAQRVAQEEGVDFTLFNALIEAESAYDPRARSRAGALGLTQLMPGTAKDLGVQNPFDPEQNLRGGAKYLGQMINRFGDIPTALAAYNAGPGAVEAAGGIPRYAETQAYVKRILDRIGVR